MPAACVCHQDERAVTRTPHPHRKARFQSAPRVRFFFWGGGGGASGGSGAAVCTVASAILAGREALVLLYVALTLRLNYAPEEAVAPQCTSCSPLWFYLFDGSASSNSRVV